MLASYNDLALRSCVPSVNESRYAPRKRSGGERKKDRVEGMERMGWSIDVRGTYSRALNYQLYHTKRCDAMRWT